MPVTSELLQAYRDSHYRMALPEQVCLLQIGQHSVQLDQYLLSQHCTQAAFVSACNPRSYIIPEAINRSRTAALEQILLARHWRYFTGVGYGTDAMKPWPAEPGYLVLNIRPELAVALGRQFDQRAVLHIPLGQAVELLLCDD